MDNRTTVIAVAGALALGAVGSSALADEDEGFERFDPVKVSQEDGRDDERDDRRDDRDRNSQGEPGRGDDDDVDVEPRDEDDDEGRRRQHALRRHPRRRGRQLRQRRQPVHGWRLGSSGRSACGGPGTSAGTSPRAGLRRRLRLGLRRHLIRPIVESRNSHTYRGNSYSRHAPGRNRTFDAEIKSLSL